MVSALAERVQKIMTGRMEWNKLRLRVPESDNEYGGSTKTSDSTGSSKYAGCSTGSNSFLPTREENRLFSVQNIADALQKNGANKGAVERSLAALVKKGHGQRFPVRQFGSVDHKLADSVRR